MIITQHTEWPMGDYDRIRQIVSSMVDGETTAIDATEDADMDVFRKVAQAYARDTLHCHQNGWRLKTSIRGNTIFLNKHRV